MTFKLMHIPFILIWVVISEC